MLRNRLAVLLAYISGVLMLLSGSTGVASLTRLKDLLLSVVEIPLIKIIFLFAAIQKKRQKIKKICLSSLK